MIKNLFEGTADLIAASLSYNLIRKKYVDYLPVLLSDRQAIFIKSAYTEEASWTTFAVPFSKDLWLSLFALSAFLALWLLLAVSHSDSSADLIFTDKVKLS